MDQYFWATREDPRSPNIETLCTDVWSSADGKNWRQETNSAPFTPELPVTAVVHDGKIFAIGYKNWAYQSNRYSHIWSSRDGINWDKVADSTPSLCRYSPESFVFDGKLWSIGGSMLSGYESFLNDNELWNGVDGARWQLVQDVLPFHNIHCEQEEPYIDKISSMMLNDQVYMATSCKNPADGRVYDIWSSTGYSGTFTLELPTSGTGLFNGQVNLSAMTSPTSGTVPGSFNITGQILPDLPTSPIQVFSPGGGETLRGGELCPIHWKSDLALAGTGIKLELWNHEGHLADLGYGWDANGEMSSTVLLPLVPAGADYQILARSTWDPQLFGVNPGPFTIKGGLLCLHLPNSDTLWHAGDLAPIWWQINPQLGGTAVRFELWRNGAQTADLGIAYDLDGETLSFVLIPSLAPASDYRLRLVSLWDERDWDECDGFITLENSAYVPPTAQTAIAPDDWLFYQ